MLHKKNKMKCQFSSQANFFDTIVSLQMLRLFWFILLLPVVFCKPEVKALWNFEEVTECVLHYNALVYNNYGCWCGVGGSHEPVDEIDDCCRHHDKCYDKAVDDGICFDVEWEYVDDYSWKCMNSTAVCGANSGCKAAFCACDTAVVACWSQYPKPTSKPKCNRSMWTKLTKWFQH